MLEDKGLDYKWQEAFEDMISGFNQTQLVEAWRILREQWDRRNTKRIAQEASKFKIGQRVRFVYKGTRVSGTIDKINKKTITLVDCSDNKKWRVAPAHLLPEIEGE